MSAHRSFLMKTTATVSAMLLAVLLGSGATVQGQATTAPKAQPPAKTKSAATTKLDLNKVTAEELIENLPGVGEVTARKIVAGRPYASVDDLAKAGVPARTIQAIRPLVVVIPVATPKVAIPPSVSPTTTPVTKKINLNTATATELQTLPGIGPVAAAAIVAGRPFKSVDDLEKIRGLGPAKIAALRDLVTVAAPAPAPTPVPAPAATAAPSASPAPTATGVARTKAATKGAVPKTPGRGGLTPGQVVNINTAPKEMLDLLPGIGPVKAQAIIKGRPFKTKEDIMKVKGIKEGEFAKIKDMIKVD
jgi:competence protein ComEA